MKVRYTKSFAATAKLLRRNEIKLLHKVLTDVKSANTIRQIADCRKLIGNDNVYRTHAGSPTAFFTILIEIVDDTATFRYLVPHGPADNKHMQGLFRATDKA